MQLRNHRVRKPVGIKCYKSKRGAVRIRIIQHLATLITFKGQEREFLCRMVPQNGISSLLNIKGSAV
jgi:hypothetical protein